MKKRNLHRKRNPVYCTLRRALILTLVVFFLPAAVFGRTARAEEPSEPEPAAVAEAEETAVTEEKEPAEEAASDRSDAAPASDSKSVTLKVKMGDQVKTMELEEYLWGVVAAEMPAATSCWGT